MKRVYVQTWGCQMNEHDSSRMLEALAREGYAHVDDPRDADVVLLNTCSVREKAVHKVRSAVGAFKGLRQHNPQLLIGVTGCVAQQEREKLLKNPAIDLVVGPDNLSRIGELVARARTEGRAIGTEWIPRKEDYPWMDAEPSPGAVSTFVTIMKGCDNVCSFCIVPYVRGPERCRAADDIVREVERHVSVGTREVMLLGQNVNSYADGETDFPALLRRVGEVPGILRVRYTTSHPKDFTQRLADVMAEVPTVCEYLHLPVQSGNDRILTRMRRGYTRAEYLARIAMARARVPHLALSTDIIVGFPGETEDEFQETLSLLREVEFDSIFPFEYSPRPHTAAIKYKDEVPAKVMRDRFARMLEVQKEITHRKNHAMVDKEVEILVEGSSRTAMKGSGDVTQLQGRTRTHKIVNFLPPPHVASAQSGEGLASVAERLAGQPLRARIIGAFFNSLRGEPLPGEVERALDVAAREASAPSMLPPPPLAAAGSSRRSLPVLGDAPTSQTELS